MHAFRPSNLIRVLTLLAASGSLQAAAYKCTTANGGIAFQDRPCAGAGGEIHVDGVPAARKPDEIAGGGSAAAPRKPAPVVEADLTGSWCEHATSKEADGEPEVAKPAEWDFANRTMSYRAYGASVSTPALYERNDDRLVMDIPALGGKEATWIVQRQEGDELVLRGPTAFHYLRRGACPDVAEVPGAG